MDPNTAQVIQDLCDLRVKVREGTKPENVQEGVRTYLCANSEVIERALAVYQTIPEGQRVQMQREHSELDRSAVSPSFHLLAGIPLDYAKKRREISADALHMLVRALHFSKYVADTSDIELAMQPVEAYFPREVRKSVRFERADKGFYAHFDIRGGLTEENRLAFDSLELKLSPGQIPCERMVKEVVTPSEYRRPTQTATEPFCESIVISAGSYNSVLFAVQNAGFKVQEPR